MGLSHRHSWLQPAYQAHALAHSSAQELHYAAGKSLSSGVQFLNNAPSFEGARIDWQAFTQKQVPKVLLFPRLAYDPKLIEYIKSCKVILNLELEDFYTFFFSLYSCFKTQ